MGNAGITDGRTVLQRVTRELRSAILTGNVVPGQHLRIRDLEEMLGASHIPIREALRSLEAEGLIEHSPNRGVTASVVSLDELHDIYDLRRLIECEAVRRAVEKTDSGHIARVSSALEELGELQDSGAPDVGLLIEGDQAFHYELLAPGLNKLLEKTLKQLWTGSERYIRMALDLLERRTLGMEEHREMIELLRRGRAQGMAELLDHHLRTTEASIVALVDLATGTDS